MPHDGASLIHGSGHIARTIDCTFGISFWLKLMHIITIGLGMRLRTHRHAPFGISGDHSFTELQMHLMSGGWEMLIQVLDARNDMTSNDWDMLLKVFIAHHALLTMSPMLRKLWSTSSPHAIGLSCVHSILKMPSLTLLFVLCRRYCCQPV